jgi:hypothetical protein
VGSAAHENKPWLDTYAGYVSEELSLPEESISYFSKELVRDVSDVDGLRRFEETVSYAELEDSADCFATLSASRSGEKGGRVAVYAQDNPQFLITRAPMCLRSRRKVQGGIASPMIFRSPTSGLSPAPCASPASQRGLSCDRTNEGTLGEPGDREGEGRVERSRRIWRRW